LLDPGVAEQRQSSLRDLLFTSRKLAVFLARQLPDNAELAAELAELLDISPRTLTQLILPEVSCRRAHAWQVLKGVRRT